MSQFLLTSLFLDHLHYKVLLYNFGYSKKASVAAQAFGLSISVAPAQFLKKEKNPVDLKQKYCS